MNDEENKKETEQTAVADNSQTTQQDEVVAERSAAQDDGLDELLKEFDDAKASPKETIKPSGETQNTTDQVDLTALARLEQRLNDQEAREQRRELERLFNEFADGVEADAVDAEAFLNAKAMRDPRLIQAYSNRNSSPKAWNDIKGRLKQDFSKRFGKKVDKTVTESRNAVEAAIRSASTAAPDKGLSSKEIAGMSKEEFDKLQNSLGVSPL